MISLTIVGAPVTKKNSPRIFRSKRTGKPFVMPSKCAVDWTDSAILQIARQHVGRPIEAHVNVAALVYRKKSTGDLLNYLAAIHDALEAAGVVANDRLIVSVDGSRLLKDASSPRVELTITLVDY